LWHRVKVNGQSYGWLRVKVSVLLFSVRIKNSVAGTVLCRG